MSEYGASEEHQPLMWVRGRPIYAAYFVVLIFVASLLLTTVLLGLRLEHVGAAMAFSSVNVMKGEVWRLVTYGLWNPPGIWFAIDMLMIAWFGRELEKFFGRGPFLFFYGGVYLLPPLFLTLIGPWRPVGLLGEPGALAVFIAFATLYPNVGMLFNLLAKWVAAILVGISFLSYLGSRDLAGMGSLCVTVGFAYGFVRYKQGLLTFPGGAFFARAKAPRAASSTPRPVVPPASLRKEQSMAELDALLDKIAHSGLSSLTPKERAKLEKGREDLQK